jgi:hypothetical protein
MCTSCLFIYLYSDIHLRMDFQSIKDHLPPCFNRLHFGQEFTDKQIDDLFQKYWSLLKCASLVGISNYRVVNSAKDDSKSLLVSSSQCVPSLTGDIAVSLSILSSNHINWSKESSILCSANKIDISQRDAKIKLNKNKIKQQNNGYYDDYDDDYDINEQIKSPTNFNSDKLNKSSSKKWLVLSFIGLSFILIAIIYIRSKRNDGGPCLRLTIPTSTKKFQRFTNSNGISAREVDHYEVPSSAAYDELNGLEYDDELEMNENRDTFNNENIRIDCEQVVYSPVIAQATDQSSDKNLTFENLKKKSINNFRNLLHNNKDILRRNQYKKYEQEEVVNKKGGFLASLKSSSSSSSSTSTSSTSAYPKYSYNSISNNCTLKTRSDALNEFGTDNDDGGSEVKEVSNQNVVTVTFNPTTEKSKPSISTTKDDTNSNNDDIQTIHLAINPLDNLEKENDQQQSSNC